MVRKNRLLVCDDDPRANEMIQEMTEQTVCVSLEHTFSNPLSAIEFITNTQDPPDYALFDANYSIGTTRFYSINSELSRKIRSVCRSMGVEYYFMSSSPRLSLDFIPPRRRFIPKYRLEKWLKDLCQ